MSRVRDMSIGDALVCSRHGETVLLTSRMKAEQTRICDACTQAYKAKHWVLQHGPRRAAASLRPKRQYKTPSPPQIIDGEVWLPIPGAPGYEASSLGRIRSVDRLDSIGRPAVGRVLRIHVGDGAVTVRIHANGKGRTWAVHQLVALAFHGPVPEGKEVAHGDGNSSNNTPGNLRYATHIENEADKVLHGTKHIPAGERNGQAKLSGADVLAIRARLAAGDSQASCAVDYGVHPSLISHIKRGAHWSHVTGGANV